MATSISAYAAENRNDGVWKQNETGWWYEFVDGSYLKNGWYWVDGNHDEVYECYYFDGNGYMAANTTIGSDMVDVNGAWVVNGVVQTKKIEIEHKEYDVEQYNAVTELPRNTATNLDGIPSGSSTEDILNMVDWSTGTSTCAGKSTFHLWH